MAQKNQSKNILSSKLESLKKILTEMESVLIAYSGGVDSTFLLKVASSVLGDKVMAVTAISETYPKKELDEAKKYANMLDIKHILIETKELDDDNFASNPPNRCYYCKKELFSKLKDLARQYDLNFVIDGSNYDDINDYRPGSIASSELGIRSPLKEVMMTKEEIRSLSKSMDLTTWNKPASPCLASRFPYGTRITKEELRRVGHAETFLAKYGIDELRVRTHGDIARIEVPKSDMHIFLDDQISKEITDKFKTLGYSYVTLDIQGYRMGSMNEPLKEEIKSGQKETN